MTRTRTKFPDAGCLFVCRPGSGDNYTSESTEAIEDKHVNIIAKQIKDLTGVRATVVTHRDKDAQGTIRRFARGSDPYLVAVNNVCCIIQSMHEFGVNPTFWAEKSVAQKVDAAG